MEYSVTQSIWYGNIGIVTVQTKYDGEKMYIGQASGLSKEDDEQQIAACGMTFYPQIFQNMS